MEVINNDISIGSPQWAIQEMDGDYIQLSTRAATGLRRSFGGGITGEHIWAPARIAMREILNVAQRPTETWLSQTLLVDFDDILNATSRMWAHQILIHAFAPGQDNDRKIIPESVRGPELSPDKYTKWHRLFIPSGLQTNPHYVQHELVLAAILAWQPKEAGHLVPVEQLIVAHTVELDDCLAA